MAMREHCIYMADSGDCLSRSQSRISPRSQTQVRNNREANKAVRIVTPASRKSPSPKCLVARNAVNGALMPTVGRRETLSKLPQHIVVGHNVPTVRLRLTPRTNQAIALGVRGSMYMEKITSGFHVVSPAYGRDYKNADAAKKDWNDGKDFYYESPKGGAYCSKRDFGTGANIEIRYAKLGRAVVVEGGAE